MKGNRASRGNRSRNTQSTGNSFTDFFKFGLGAGLGAGVSTMLFILVGLAFFIPGVVLLGNERKKPEKERDQTHMIGAYILMGIGVVVGLGIGASFLFSNILTDVMAE